jgi:hypothetical protein
MVILAHFNFFILKLYQRNVYNRHLLLFLTSENIDVNKCIVVDNGSLKDNLLAVTMSMYVWGGGGGGGGGRLAQLVRQPRKPV